jgi:hypothetical protein
MMPSVGLVAEVCSLDLDLGKIDVLLRVGRTCEKHGGTGQCGDCDPSHDRVLL